MNVHAAALGSGRVPVRPPAVQIEACPNLKDIDPSQRSELHELELNPSASHDHPEQGRARDGVRSALPAPATTADPQSV